MVKFGSHILFLQGKLPGSFLVEYKKVQRVGAEEGAAAFVAAWRESLAKASAAKEEAMASLWAQVFSSCATAVGWGTHRGLRPTDALHVFHGTVGPAETQRLVDAFSEVRMASVANWEALRKLVKKFDKQAKADKLSDQLLPLLYASSISSLVTASDPFETLRELVMPDDAETPTSSTSGDQDIAAALAKAAIWSEPERQAPAQPYPEATWAPAERRVDMPAAGVAEHAAADADGGAGGITCTVRLTGHLYNRGLLERTLDVIEGGGGVTQSVGNAIMGGSRRRASVILLRVDGVRDVPAMDSILDGIRAIFDEDRAARFSEVEALLATSPPGRGGGQGNRSASANGRVCCSFTHKKKNTNTQTHTNTHTQVSIWK